MLLITTWSIGKKNANEDDDVTILTPPSTPLNAESSTSTRNTHLSSPVAAAGSSTTVSKTSRKGKKQTSVSSLLDPKIAVDHAPSKAFSY